MKYEPEFLAFWSNARPIGRRLGDKAEAHRVWVTKRRPSGALLLAGWNRYRISCGDGFTVDAERWIKKDGWLKEWEPAPPARAAIAGSAHLTAAKNYSDGMDQWPGGKANAT